MTKSLTTRHAASLPARVLTAQQEKFAQHYATFGSAELAYRHAYNVETTRRASVQQTAYRVLHHPAVAARITTLRNADAADELASRERLIADLEAMVNVDANELMQLKVIPCGACWPTPEAWPMAAAAALDAGHEAPAEDEPNPKCVPCGGAGRNVGHLTNTADLSLPARRMFKGLEFFPDGGIKRVLLHDAAQLRIELHKLKGLHIDRSISLNVHADIKPLPANVSVEDALRMLETIAPAPSDAPIDNASIVSDQ
jgi:hypothetical protein